MKKDQFKPDQTELNMTLKEAYLEVIRKQRDLSVAVQNKLPRDILLINKCLSYRKLNKLTDKNLDSSMKEIIKNIENLNKEFDKLSKSKAARIVAVHRVITNKGFKSPGKSKEPLPKTNQEYLNLVLWLRKTMRKPSVYKTDPLDRIYLLKTNKTNKFPDIPKPSKELGDTYSNNEYLRPISIPSIKDRILQAAYYISYSVYSEYIADAHSYAFRPGRSPAWGAHNIGISLKNPGNNFNWALEIDISKCFDSICHEFIVNYTPFIPKTILHKWLKQGYLLKNFEDIGLIPTNSGIPQGGIISPVLCNTILDGAEEFIRNKLYEDITNKIVTKQNSGYTNFRKGIKLFSFCRYADDIVILTKTKFIAIKCQEYFSEFLKPRGLKLSDKKTKLTDISGGSAYFEFTGYGFKKITIQAENRTKWLIIPPANNVKRIKSKLSKICHSKTSIEKLYYEFNLTLRSWVGYYSTTNAFRVLQELNRWVFKIFYHALKRRIKLDNEIRLQHSINKTKSGKKKRKKIGERYLYKVIRMKYLKYIKYHGNYRMLWYSIKLKDSRKEYFNLFCPVIFKLHDERPLTKQYLNYYNKDDIIEITKVNLNYKYGTRKNILKDNFHQYGGVLTCPCCNLPFAEAGKYEIHHITPVKYGGNNEENNLMPICKPCHKEITAAVANKDRQSCIEYIQRDLLMVPELEFNEFI
jgi:RNA-directed DNA polymerase